MNHVIAFFVSAFVGMQLIVSVILFPGVETSTAYLLTALTALTAIVGMLGAAIRELEIGMLRFRDEHPGVLL